MDLERIGPGIKRLPPCYWEPRMLFFGASDTRVREVTGEFPHTVVSRKSTHPLFVLKTLPGVAQRVCPCSSKDWGARRSIRRGCVLQYTGVVTDRASYLVESCSFNLPLDPAFLGRLEFRGRVPEECLDERMA
ncbi:MAG: hypothetical protein GX443_19125 [Deltaproteobacteria bacterium]|nr:hypothetical protein [Deltaproteobacteria bacterium]